MENIEDTNKPQETKNDENKPIYDGCGCANPNAFSQSMKDGFDKVFDNMKSICIAFIAALAIFLTGCITTVSVDDMAKLGGAAGFTTAYVLNNQVKVGDSSREVIIEVVTKLDKYLPATNETCSAKWTPMVKELTDKYVAEGNLTQKQADRVVKDFKTVSTMLDNYIDKKGVRQYQDIVDAFIHSFSDKFLANFKPSNVVSSSNGSEECNKEMYDFLTEEINK